jgi:hypothetical protein
MTVYADYAYYTGTYLGTVIAESDFPQLALRASQVIDNLTFGRAITDTDNTDAIKMAMCAVAEELQTQRQNGDTDGIASESQGQYSVSFLATSRRSRSNESKLRAAASLYLQNTGLMFAGFNSGEYGSFRDS